MNESARTERSNEVEREKRAREKEKNGHDSTRVDKPTRVLRLLPSRLEQ